MIEKKIGKWQHIELLQQNNYIARYLPETALYSRENLTKLLNRHTAVYVKHNTSGQGRGIFKVTYNDQKQICLNGYFISGNQVNQCVDAIDDVHQLLHPFEKFGRQCATYIVQEGIASNAQNGQPISIRVHIQKLHGKWLIGGMNGRIATNLSKNGIANSYRGADVFALNDLFKVHLSMKTCERKRVVKKLRKIAIRVAKVMEIEAPNREYGIDFGLNEKRKPILFEVNTTPGISSFAKIEDGVMWQRIMRIRKMQRESNG